METPRDNKQTITRALKIGVFAAFLFLYFTNHVFFETLAAKINHELLKKYRRTYPVEVANRAGPTPTPLRSVIVPISPEPVVDGPTEIPSRVATSRVNRTVTEDELWQALMEYRTDHKKKQIDRADKLCQYARRRAQELSDRLQTNPEDPLDAHEGFKRDAESGYVFDVTGFTSIGENLAYTPGFTTGTQIIEWGWDTSSGHRSLQLSDDITHGCLTGIHPVYVGIFGS
jgi:hypothetical protein